VIGTEATDIHIFLFLFVLFFSSYLSLGRIFFSFFYIALSFSLPLPSLSPTKIDVNVNAETLPGSQRLRLVREKSR